MQLLCSLSRMPWHRGTNPSAVSVACRPVDLLAELLECRPGVANAQVLPTLPACVHSELGRALLLCNSTAPSLPAHEEGPQLMQVCCSPSQRQWRAACLEGHADMSTPVLTMRGCLPCLPVLQPLQVLLRSWACHVQCLGPCRTPLWSQRLPRAMRRASAPTWWLVVTTAVALCTWVPCWVLLTELGLCPQSGSKRSLAGLRWRRPLML